MEHLMIDDIGDKVRRKMGMIEKTVDPNKLSSVVKRAERPFALCFSQGIAKPGNGKAKLSLKIALIERVEDLKQIVGGSQREDSDGSCFHSSFCIMIFARYCPPFSLMKCFSIPYRLNPALS